MALLNQLDEATTTRALTRWLAGKLPDATDIVVTGLHIPQSAGMSMTTILFAASWTENQTAVELDLVARVAPSEPGVFMDPNLENEFRIMKLLGEHTDVAVPRARWYEGDRAVLGSEFLIVDRAFGEVPSDDPPYVTEGWVMDLAPERRGALYDHAVHVVSQIQAVDWKGLGLDFLDKPRYGSRGLDEQIGYWETVYGWAGGGEVTSPTIDAALDWVKANKPHGEDLVLNWGDPRIGNIMFAPEDLSVQAVLDWEMATIASPEMELGWLILFPRYYSEGIGLEIPAGLPNREELIRNWERATNRTARHVDFYEAFAALRLAILMVRAGCLMIAGGALPAGNPMPISNPASQILAKLLGLPAPAGDSTSFIGNR